MFSVWLIHAGIWTALIAASQPILSGLLRISNWYVQRYLPTGNLVEEIPWNVYFTMGSIVEDTIPIIPDCCSASGCFAGKQKIK